MVAGSAAAVAGTTALSSVCENLDQNQKIRFEKGCINHSFVNGRTKLSFS